MNNSIKFQNYWNLLLATDSYKASHSKMYPEGLTYMESYFESRGGDFPYSIFFGLQYYIKSYLLGQQITQDKLDEAKVFFANHFGNDNVFDTEMWQYIIDVHNGYLPIGIDSVKEGSIVSIKNILFKIYNTDPKCAKVVNYIETLLMKVWYPVTIATNSFAGMEIIKYHADQTGVFHGNEYKLHDFSARGVATEEQSAIGGAANLLTFDGTDNIAGILLLQNFYKCTTMPGFSVPASEHSTMCAGGKENEMQTVKRILTQYPTGIVSIVIDTWDTMGFCRKIAEDAEIKKLILERNGKVVLRPDSGEPHLILEQCLDILADGFGFTTNSKGFKTINEKLGLIQGDGINIYTMNQILNYLTAKGWSIDNLVFGSGGGLLQHFNRDTMKFAIKASHVVVDRTEMDIFKDPITSKGSKKSKTGKLNLYWTTSSYATYNQHEIKNHPDLVSALANIYLNGMLIEETSYDEIQERMKFDLIRLENITETIEKQEA